jgi:hypothetical protein
MPVLMQIPISMAMAMAILTGPRNFYGTAEEMQIQREKLTF